MKCSTIFLVLGTCLLLTGCENKDIEAVKKSMLGGTTFTTGQAFDNRKVCASTKWSTMEDRGRTIVEYRCDLAGADEFNKAQLAPRLSNIQKISEQYKSKLQAELDAANLVLATQQPTSSGAPPSAALEDDATKTLRARIAGSIAVQAWLQSDNVDVLATSQPPEINTGLSRLLNHYLDVKAAGGDPSLLVKPILIERAQNILDIASQIEQEQQTLKDQAKATVDGAAAQRAGLNEQEASAIAKMKADYSADHVYELFQWVVPESGDPELIYVGNEFVAPDGTVKDRRFQNVSEPVNAIIKNDMTAYPDYVRQLQPWLQDT